MTANKGKVLLQVQGLEKKFDDNQVLDGITTDICQGEVVAVIGPSGSGKSTFLRSLNLLEVPTGGKILFEGVDITDPKVDINRHHQERSCLKERILQISPWISTRCVRKSVWYFSSSICFHIRQ